MLRFTWRLRKVGLLLALLLFSCKRPPPPTASADVGSQQAAPDSTPAAKTKPKLRHLSAKGCSGCHPQQYRQWKVSLHALAHKEPIYDFYFIKASRQSNKEMESFCAPCHTPIAVMTGKIPFAQAR